MECNIFWEWVELEEYSRRTGIAAIVVIDFGGLLFRNRMISVPFELEYVEFEVLVPGIPLPEKSQKECGLSFAILTDVHIHTGVLPYSPIHCEYVSGLCLGLLDLQLQPTHLCNTSMQYDVSPASQSKFREKLIKYQVWRENR